MHTCMWEREEVVSSIEEVVISSIHGGGSNGTNSLLPDLVTWQVGGEGLPYPQVPCWPEEGENSP